MAGKIYVGVGGWTFEPWRGTFYPEGLTHKRELEYASRKLTSIEINGTYYSSFKPASWAKWRAETPGGFVFAMKASRFCTNRRQLGEAGDSVARFVGQGLVELGDRLGPINWQFMATKKFDPEDIEAFLKLLPREAGKLPLRHALEVRHPSFQDRRFYDLARKYNAAIVYAHDEDFPEIDEPTADFTYARLMGAQEKVKTGYKPADIMQSLMATMMARSNNPDAVKVLVPAAQWGFTVDKGESDEAAGVTVKQVLKDSPADQAGLKAGDRLLTLEELGLQVPVLLLQANV